MYLQYGSVEGGAAATSAAGREDTLMGGGAEGMSVVPLRTSLLAMGASLVARLAHGSAC